MNTWTHKSDSVDPKGGAGVDLEGLRRKNGGLNIIKTDCMYARNSQRFNKKDASLLIRVQL